MDEEQLIHLQSNTFYTLSSQLGIAAFVKAYKDDIPGGREVLRKITNQVTKHTLEEITEQAEINDEKIHPILREILNQPDPKEQSNAIMTAHKEVVDSIRTQITEMFNILEDLD